MSAEVLREAAALMRVRANAARSYYASHHPKAGEEVPWFTEADLYDFEEGDGPHIIGMSPAVALAVADSLDQAAAVIEEATDGPLAMAMNAIAEPLVTVARTYLGGDDA
jgi:hypothetical protein